jgi:uncharacterized protein YndB with AHSA1/START domain
MSTKLDQATKPSLTLKRRLKAPPAKVYAAWIEPEKVARWWGPGPSVVLRAEFDARVGGRFRVVFRCADGEEHDVSGVYREVVPDKKLAFTWAWRSTPERESQVTLDFEPDGDGTLLTLTHAQFFDEAARDGHREGWSSTLDKLVQLFA